MKRRTAVHASIGLAACLALTACGSAHSAGGTTGPATLTVALSSPPNCLDPAQSATGQFLDYIDPAYATLLTLGADGTIGAGLAAKWGYAGTGNTRFQLTLRSG
jgi:peptide/nickel transport system substrate-binding protein